jgi:hypothetical protein
MLHRGIMAHDTSMLRAASRALDFHTLCPLSSGTRTVARRPAGGLMLPAAALPDRKIKKFTKHRNLTGCLRGRSAFSAVVLVSSISFELQRRVGKNLVAVHYVRDFKTNHVRDLLNNVQVAL